jgi:hypothetical protein
LRGPPPGAIEQRHHEIRHNEIKFRFRQPIQSLAAMGSQE